MKLQRVIDFSELLVDLASESESPVQVVADEAEERAGNRWYNEHSVPTSTAKLFIPDRDPDSVVRENERWWELEDGTLVFVYDTHGVIIAPGDEPPEIHTHRLTNVVPLRR